ncbi:mucin-13 [Aquarana catesbeiana]|uniref:mucin-13 n=1 Tax=Aquarana catesbeiana TaxID=8400 RepID=UPI003CC995E7
MRGILSICVTCGLLLAYVGATTIVPTSTISSIVTTDSNSTSNANTTSSVSTTSTTTTSTTTTSTTTTTTVSAPTSNNATNNNVTTPPGVSGNTTEEDTTSFSTQDTSSSNDTGITSNPNVTMPSPDTTEVAVTTTTANPMSCSSNPCGDVQCVQLSNDYVCRCPLGFAFINSTLSCHQGDAFYGEVTITGVEFSSDPTSPQYAAVYKDVINNFRECFVNFTTYLNTAILEIRQTTTKNARNTNTVVAQVSNYFGPGTINKTIVDDTVIYYIQKINNFGSYADKTICSSGVYCDDATTTCTPYNSGQNAECTCKSGLYSSQPIITTCRECAPDCTASSGRQCKQGDIGTAPQCVCLPGYKSKDGGCKTCDFGYSGEECKDNYLLILVIVGAVLGAVVLGLLGAVIGVSVRSRKGKSGERAELIDNDKLARGSPAPGSLFPKVQMKSDVGQVNRASNVYEDEEEEYRRSMPKRDYDENPWYEMDRKDRNY